MKTETSILKIAFLIILMAVIITFAYNAKAKTLADQFVPEPGDEPSGSAGSASAKPTPTKPKAAPAPAPKGYEPLSAKKPDSVFGKTAWVNERSLRYAYGKGIISLGKANETGRLVMQPYKSKMETRTEGGIFGFFGDTYYKLGKIFSENDELVQTYFEPARENILVPRSQIEAK